MIVSQLRPAQRRSSVGTTVWLHFFLFLRHLLRELQRREGGGDGAQGPALDSPLGGPLQPLPYPNVFIPCLWRGPLPHSARFHGCLQRSVSNHPAGFPHVPWQPSPPLPAIRTLHKALDCLLPSWQGLGRRVKGEALGKEGQTPAPPPAEDCRMGSHPPSVTELAGENPSQHMSVASKVPNKCQLPFPASHLPSSCRRLLAQGDGPFLEPHAGPTCSWALQEGASSGHVEDQGAAKTGGLRAWSQLGSRGWTP